MLSARARWIALGAILAIAAAACAGDDGGDGASTQEPAGGAQASVTSPTDEPIEAESGEKGGEAEEEPSEAVEPTVTVEDSDFGEILVDPDGRTLYVFLADADAESTCYDACEGNWPPLLVEGDPVAGDGVDAALLGTAERRDGSVQVTYDGRPLYFFAGDRARDDVNGQGVGDVWFVVSPAGGPIQEAPASGNEENGRDYY